MKRMFPPQPPSEPRTAHHGGEEHEIVSQPKKKRSSAAALKDVIKKRGLSAHHDTVPLTLKKPCSVEGCTKQTQKGVFCWKHGGERVMRRCRFDECSNVIKKGGLCWRHGAKEISVIKPRKPCSNEGCASQSQKGGLCMRHWDLRHWCTSRVTKNQGQYRALLKTQRERNW